VTGEGAILGRGAVIQLRDDPRALRVRLDGAVERRVRLAMGVDQNLDHEHSERSLRYFDRAREVYWQQFYATNIRDAALYHVVLDSTAIELGACVDIVAEAAHALRTAVSEASLNGPQQ
jgi:cytidylate kinase